MKLIDSYKTLCTEFYDLDKPVAENEALEYYLSEAANSIQPVLEPMCGSGRFLVPLMEHGILIEGTDASPEMLNSCESKCTSKNLKPVLYYQSLQEMILPKKYGMVFIPSGSFGLIIKDGDVKESLKRIISCLIPLGKLLIEIETPIAAACDVVAGKREVRRDENSKIELASKSHYDSASNTLTTEFIYRSIENGKLTLTESEMTITRHYSKSDFSELLSSAGFSGIEALKPYTKEAASDEDEMILFRCSKI